MSVPRTIWAKPTINLSQLILMCGCCAPSVCLPRIHARRTVRHGTNNVPAACPGTKEHPQPRPYGAQPARLHDAAPTRPFSCTRRAATGSCATWWYPTTLPEPLKGGGVPLLRSSLREPNLRFVPSSLTPSMEPSEAPQRQSDAFSDLGCPT